MGQVRTVRREVLGNRERWELVDSTMLLAEEASETAAKPPLAALVVRANPGVTEALDSSTADAPDSRAAVVTAQVGPMG